MISIVKMSSGYYGKHFDLEDEVDRDGIDTFIQEGTPVILVSELQDLEEIGINPDDIELTM